MAEPPAGVYDHVHAFGSDGAAASPVAEYNENVGATSGTSCATDDIGERAANVNAQVNANTPTINVIVVFICQNRNP
jgi:hypothetical protein